ncbi:MAG TPA: hypothetical protein VGQ87_03705 [Patescibacteria group bacterium]|nr:hypothetical protein [Patescibacteria group bacterium]
MQKIKIYSLGLVSVFLITLCWWLMKTALYNSQPIIYWAWVALAALLWMSVYSFFVIVVHDKLLYSAVTILTLAGYLLLLPKDVYVMAGGLLFAVLMFLFRNRLKSVEKNQLHFSLRQTIGSGTIIMIYAFLLVLGFNIYNNTSHDFKENPERFYDKLGETAAKSVPFLSKGVLQIDTKQTLDEFLTKQAEKDNPNAFSQVPSSQKQQAVSETRNQFLKQFGINASGNEMFADVLSRVVTAKVKEVVKPYERFFPLIFTLAILGLLRTFAFLFDYLTLFVCWILFRILQGVKFFKITKVQIEVDKLEI